MSEQYHIRLKGQVQGPFSVEELHDLAKRGRFSRLHQVSTDGVAWERATKHPQLFPTLAMQMPQAQLPPAGDLHLAEPEVAGEPSAGVSDAALSDNALQPAGSAAHEKTASHEKTVAADAMWYYTQGAEEAGPVLMADLQQLLAAGKLSAHDMLWTDSMVDWVEANTIAELFPPASANSASFAGGASGKSKMATTSLVLSILGFFCIPFFGSLGGVVCGHLARNEIRASGNTLGGSGSALTGLVLGYLGLSLLLLVIVISIIVILVSSS